MGKYPEETLYINEISKLIESGEIVEATHKIEIYLGKRYINKEIYCFLGIISIIEENYSEAELYINKGLEIAPNDVDLLFNKGYLHQRLYNIELAYHYYELAKSLTQEIDIINEIQVSIDELSLIAESLPKVSIIITTYNRKEMLIRALESAKNQTYLNKEIIVVDDCSTDGTNIEMEKYRNNNEIIYVKNPTNYGMIFNVMQAFYNYASGEYVIFIDHDDYLVDNHFICKAVKILNENSNISMVVGNAYIKNEHTNEVYANGYDLDAVISGRDYFLNYKIGHYYNINSGLSTVFRKETAIKMGCLKEVTHCKDLFLHLKLMLAGDVWVLKDYVGVYTLHSQNISKSLPLEFDYTTINELKVIKNYCLQNGFSDEEIDKWFETQVYLYLSWRFYELWNVGRRGEALDLLNNFKGIQPTSVNQILTSI
ncbi:glycosyltransferase family 2 protein [Bacillus timonensis]|uniref:glycosyltransferase family 2 protein n=1 Tax=Bacillus timonensis TaxID=1033734 RepID=UPI000288E26F|nr:glycosyltransferase family 2 protein [Bacillus timonensis]